MNWLWAAITTTIIYLVVLVEGLGRERIIGFLKTDNLNAVGDFLAGTFAPLAFIWLVAAVLTQRQELTEARKQFEKSSDQFKKNQEVIDEQLRLVDQQNRNAERQAVRSYKLDLFEYRFEIFKEVDAIARKIGPTNIHEKASEAADKLSVLGHRSMFLFNDTVSLQLRSIAAKLEMLRRQKARLDAMIVPMRLKSTNTPRLIEGVDPAQFAGEEREHQMLLDEIIKDLSFPNRTKLFSKYLDVTDAMNTLIVSASGKKRNEDDMSGLYKEWRND